MSAPKHSPAPWVYDDYEWAPEPHVRSSARHWSICAVHDKSGCTDPARDISRAEAEANARLIAAAPDLLESIRPLAPADEATAALFATMDPDDTVTITVPVRCIRRAEAAIAKAEGAR